MVGFVSLTLSFHLKVVMVHLRNLLENMVEEEETLKTRLMSNVETYGEELMNLCKELALPPHEVSCKQQQKTLLFILLSYSENRGLEK